MAKRRQHGCARLLLLGIGNPLLFVSRCVEGRSFLRGFRHEQCASWNSGVRDDRTPANGRQNSRRTNNANHKTERATSASHADFLDGRKIVGPKSGAWAAGNQLNGAK
jgi:hypothetical protein